MAPITFTEKRNEILRALTDLGFIMTSDSLSQAEYVLIDGFVNQPIQSELSGDFVVGGPTIPLVMLLRTRTKEIVYIPLKALINVNI